jgi:hypothetical protein
MQVPTDYEYSIDEFEDYMTQVPTQNFWTIRDTPVECMMGEILRCDRYGYNPAVPRVYDMYFVDVCDGKIVNMTCHHKEGDILWCERPSEEHKTIMRKFGLTNIPVQIA